MLPTTYITNPTPAPLQSNWCSHDWLINLIVICEFSATSLPLQC